MDFISNLVFICLDKLGLKLDGEISVISSMVSLFTILDSKLVTSKSVRSYILCSPTSIDEGTCKCLIKAYSDDSEYWVTCEQKHYKKSLSPMTFANMQMGNDHLGTYTHECILGTFIFTLIFQTHDKIQPLYTGVVVVEKCF